MHRIVCLLLSLLAVGCAHAPTPSAPTHHHRFDDPQAWAKEFESPERAEWQKPDEVIAALSLPADAVVADLGAGTGYFSVRLAAAVPQGRVYGLDVEPQMTRYLEERAHQENLLNLRAVQVAPDDPGLPEPVDLVLMVNTYHHVENRADYLQVLAKSLQPGGRVAVIDYTQDAPKGPPPQMRLPPSQVVAEFTAAGFRQDADFTFLPRQYFLVFVGPEK